MPRKPDTEKPAVSGDDLSPSKAPARARKPAKPRAANANKVASSKKPATTAAKKPVKPSPKPATPRKRRSAEPEGTTKITNPVKLPPKAQQAIDISAFQGLDGRQAKFVDLWLVTYNASQSYRDAGYKCKNDNVARVGAHKLLMKVKNHPYTLARQVELFSRTADVQNQLIATYHAASFADPRDLVEYVRRCCRYCYGKGFKFQLRPSEMERRRAEYDAAKAEAERDNKEIGEFDELGLYPADVRSPLTELLGNRA